MNPAGFHQWDQVLELVTIHTFVMGFLFGAIMGAFGLKPAIVYAGKCVLAAAVFVGHVIRHRKKSDDGFPRL